MTKLLTILAVLLLLALGAGLLVPLLVDPNDFRDEIVERVREATGRELRIEGDLGISVFPWLGVSVERASLASPPAFGGEPFARLARAELTARLMPLLERRLEVDRVRIEGLRLNLVRDAEGRANWEGLGAPVPPPAAPPASAAAPGGSGGAPTGVWVAVDQIELAGGHLTFDDRTSGRSLTVEGLAGEAGPIVPGMPVELSVAGVLIDGVSGMRAPFRAAGRFATLVEPTGEARIIAEGLTLDLNASGGPLEDGTLPVAASASAAYAPVPGTLSAPGITIRSAGLSLSGDLAAEGLDGEPVFSGRLALPAHDLRAWLARRGLRLPATADPQALTRVGASLAWRLAGDRLSLDALDLALDGTRTTGSALLLLTDPLGYRFDLDADRLDLDRYRLLAAGDTAAAPLRQGPVPAQSPAAAAPSPAPASPPAPDPRSEAAHRSPPDPTPVPAVVADQISGMQEPAPAVVRFPGALAGLDLDGRLRVTELRLAGLSLGEAALRLSAQGGVLDAANRVARFYQGRTEGRAGLDLTGDQPRVRLSQRLSGVAAGPLLMDLAGQAHVTGTGHAAVDLTAAGMTAQALLASLDGRVSLALHDGVVKGLDLEGLVRAAEARLKGRAAPSGDEDLAYTDLTATGVIRKGVLSNDDLRITSAYLRVTGRGTVDLPGERFDYLFEPVFVKPPKGRGIKELEDIPIPVRLTGTFAQPEWRVDLAEALGGKAGQRLQEELKREGGVLRELEERTGIKGLEQGLRGLFGH